MHGSVLADKKNGGVGALPPAAKPGEAQPKKNITFFFRGGPFSVDSA